MEEIKYQMQENPKEIRSYPEQSFEDDIKKQTMRVLYYILKRYI
jgi:hypothetical protein